MLKLCLFYKMFSKVLSFSKDHGCSKSFYFSFARIWQNITQNKKALKRDSS